MSLKTEYRGYTISYSENLDEWTCYDTGTTAATLSKAKAHIDKLHLRMRKDAAFPCFEIEEGYDEIHLIDATVIDYVKPVYSSSWSSAARKLIDHEVASMAQRPGSEKKSRRLVRLSGLVKDDPAVPGILSQINANKRMMASLMKQNEDLKRELPRVTLEDISGLVEAASATITESDDQ